MQSDATSECPMPRACDGKAFFQKLGERICALRVERGLTQTQLGQLIGYSQQQVVSFEKARRRVPVSTLPELARALGVTVEDLLGAKVEPVKIKRGPPPMLHRQVQRIARLSPSKQRVVTEMIEIALQRAGA